MKNNFTKFVCLVGLIIALCGAQFLSVNLSFAQNSGINPTGTTNNTGVNPTGPAPTATTQTVPALQNPLSKINSVGDAVNSFVQIITYLAIIAAVLALIWTGLQFILARGNPKKAADEGKKLGWILIGVAIILGARIMVGVILSTLGATGTVKPDVINSANQALNGNNL